MLVILPGDSISSSFKSLKLVSSLGRSLFLQAHSPGSVGLAVWRSELECLYQMYLVFKMKTWNQCGVKLEDQNWNVFCFDSLLKNFVCCSWSPWSSCSWNAAHQLLGNGLLTAGGGQQRLRGSEGHLWHCFPVCPESLLAAHALWYHNKGVWRKHAASSLKYTPGTPKWGYAFGELKNNLLLQPECQWVL